MAQGSRIRLPMQETQVQSLGWENPTKEETGTHSRILALEIPRKRGARRATVHGVTKELDTLSN